MPMVSPQGEVTAARSREEHGIQGSQGGEGVAAAATEIEPLRWLWTAWSSPLRP